MSITYTSPHPHYDLVNKNGARLCHAISCRKHTKLEAAYGGNFCPAHLPLIRSIRQRILHDVSTREKLEKEVAARTEESRFRKVMEPGHMHHLAKLEEKLRELYKNPIAK